MIYRPAQATPIGEQSIVRYLFRELSRISQAFETAPVIAPTLNVEPERPQEGQIIIADGTDFNPGSGNGLYVYLNGAWTFIV